MNNNRFYNTIKQLLTNKKLTCNQGNDKLDFKALMMHLNFQVYNRLNFMLMMSNKLLILIIEIWV